MATQHHQQQDGDHPALIADLLQRVVQEDDEGYGGGSYAPTSTQFNGTNRISPLSSDALTATPIKDPLADFNSWVRNQPPSHGGTPNHPGGHGGGPFQHSPASWSVQSNPSPQRTPPIGHGGNPYAQFHGHSATSNASPIPLDGPLFPGGGGGGHGHGGHGGHGGGVALGGNLGHLGGGGGGGHGQPSLDEIQKQRRALMSQMEQLTAREMELRQASGNGNGDMHHGHHNVSPVGGHRGGQSLSNAAVSNDAPTFFPEAAVNNYATNTNTMDSIRGSVYETAKDQHGCRFLQRMLECGGYEALEASQVILAEICPHVPELMTDQYANFLIQKLFEFMPNDIRINVARIVAPHLSDISLTPHGTFSVQKLIETITSEKETEIIIEALKPNVVMLVKDVNGNHVIQKVLQRFDFEQKQFIYDALAAECVPISTNRQGCCVLQRCLEFASPDQQRLLVQSVTQNALQLVQDPFGNYVVQYVLDGNEPDVNHSIGEAFVQHIVPLSTNKFSSNVVEKILKLGPNSIRAMIITELQNSSALSTLLNDDYGNYVVQTGLSVSNQQQFEALSNAIRPLMRTIRHAPYVKKLEAKLEAGRRRGPPTPMSNGGGGGRGPRYSPPPGSNENTPTRGMGGGGGGGGGMSGQRYQHNNSPGTPNHHQQGHHQQGHHQHQQQQMHPQQQQQQQQPGGYQGDRSTAGAYRGRRY